MVVTETAHIFRTEDEYSMMSMMNYDSMENYVMDMMAKSGMEVDAEAMPETLNQLIGLAGLGSDIVRHDQSNAICCTNA